MAKKPTALPEGDTHRAAAEIIKRLEKAANWNGRRRVDVFRDFVDITLATLEALPGHLQAVTETGALAPQDTPETQELFQRCRATYKDHTWPLIGEAFGLLLQSVALDWEEADTIGMVYMQWEIGNVALGQYFTPWDVARAMAAMAIPDGEAIIRDHLITATRGHLLAESALLAGLLATGPDEPFLALARVVSYLPDYQPYRVYDPACGSGIMLLAGASRFPWWANALGLVQYSGQDSDPLCTKMARINMHLYGLNRRVPCDPLAKAALLHVPVSDELKPSPTAPPPPASVVNIRAFQQLSLFEEVPI